jgi:hypothetical protein
MQPGPLRRGCLLLGALALFAASPAAPVPTARAAPAASEPWTVVGRVVDEARRPVAGAEVAVCVGEREELGRSAADGTFRIACDSPPPDQPYAAVRATRGDDVGVTHVNVDPALLSTADAHTVVIRPGVPLVITVDGTSAPAVGAKVFAMVDCEGPVNDPWGPERPWAGWAFRATTDARGIARFERVPSGDAAVLAFAEGPRRGEARLDVGDSGATGTVVLEEARDVTVTVLSERGGRPILGAFVGVERRRRVGGWWARGDALDSPLSALATGETGTTVLRSLPIDEGFVLYSFGTGWVWPYTADTSVMLEPRTRTMKIQVPSVDRLTAHLGGESPPAAGTPVRLRPLGGGLEGWRRSHGIPVAEAVVADGRLALVGRHVHPFKAVAELPDGRRAVVWTRSSTANPHFFGRPEFLDVRPEPLLFTHAARLELRLRDEEGRPASGVAVRTYDVRGGRWDDVVAVTDTEGTAVFNGLMHDEVAVGATQNVDFVEPQQWAIGDLQLGQVDLRSRDVRMEAMVPSRSTAILRVRTDGRPGLPPHFALRVRQFNPGVVGFEPPDAVVDPHRGEIRFTASPTRTDRRALYVVLRSPGYAPADAWMREESPGGPLVGDMVCERGGTLVAVADPARDREWAPTLQVREDGEWALVHRLARDPLVDEIRSARRVWKNLWAAEYRVVDALTGIASESVNIDPMSGPAVVHLDLRAAGYVTVSVIDVHHRPVMDTNLVVEGSDQTTTWSAAGGSGRARVPGDRMVTIRVKRSGQEAAPSTSNVMVRLPGTFRQILFVPK